MGRKKKYKQKGPKTTQPAEEVQKVPLKKKTSAARIVIGTSIGLAVLFGLYYTLSLLDIIGGDLSSMDIKRNPFLAAKEYVKEESQFEDFLGSEACASCHKDEYDKWERSTHGQAGGDPGKVKVIGKFDGVERRFQDAVVTPYIDDEGNYMFSLKVNGLPDHTFKVEAVVGGGHMVGGGTQTFFTKFPDGTTRFLPFDFHNGEQVWFGETREAGWQPISDDRIIDKATEYLPSRSLGLQLTNKSCQECHGSQIQLEYDKSEQIYKTNYKSLSINCESCHGAGKEHVEIMNSDNWQSYEDIGMKPLAALDKDQSLNVCFRCHALKDPLDNDFNAGGFLPGNDLEDYYALKYPIFTAGSYHADGRVKEFGYQQNHLSSDCYVNGSMTCVDCHDPHSQSYRDINGVELVDRFDDGQCTSCHASKAKNPELHTYHKIGSEGSKCVSCHMPYLQHQGIGNTLRFSRSDHVIPIPRPAFDEKIGIENACVKCHADITTEELQAKTVEWYGDIKPHNPSISNVNKYVAGMDIETASDLLLSGDPKHGMAQMEGLTRFSKDYLSPGMTGLDKGIVRKLMDKAESPDLDIKSLALASLHMALDNDPEVHNYLVKSLNDLEPADESKVRARWAHSMPYFSVKFEQAGDMQSAIDLNLKALEIQPKNVAIIINLARIYTNVQDIENAMEYYTKAINIDDSNEIAWLNLGIIFEQSRDDRALAFYQSAIKANPWNYQVHFTLGKYYNNSGNFELAIKSLRKAIEIDSRIAITYFHLASSYLRLNEVEKAIEQAKMGLVLNPNDNGGRNLLRQLEASVAKPPGQ